MQHIPTALLGRYHASAASKDSNPANACIVTNFLATWQLQGPLLGELPGNKQRRFTLKGQSQGVAGPGVHTTLDSIWKGQHNAAVVGVVLQASDDNALHFAACCLHQSF